MRLTVIVLMVLVASLAWADPRIVAKGETGFGSAQYEWEPLKEVVIKWQQLPLLDGNGISSEWRTYDDWLTESADDFYCEGGHPIVAVEWWGIERDDPAITHFMVRFYSDVPAPPFSHPGDLLYEQAVYDWTEEPVARVDVDYHYSAELPVAFEQVAGNIYWISIQAVHTEDARQWFWKECIPDDYWNDEGVIRAPGAGIPDWTPISDAIGSHMELAFVLYADVMSPVNETTWGSIKAMFD
jgi:hypothetical protein